MCPEEMKTVSQICEHSCSFLTLFTINKAWKHLSGPLINKFITGKENDIYIYIYIHAHIHAYTCAHTKIDRIFFS